MPDSPDIRICSDGQAWLHQACALIRDVSECAIQSHGRCLVALSGGSTPKMLYGALTAPVWRSQIPWDRLVFLFGDERCVPPDHPDSNYGLAHTAFFQPLAIQPGQIHRMKGESPDPVGAAREYEQTLRELTACAAPGIPSLDLVLLGLGDDGHTASLFPGTEALAEQRQLVTVGVSPKGIALRLTLTLGVLNRATVVLFLVSGAGKAETVRAVLEPRNETEQALPAALVKPDKGRLIWLLDRSAGAVLSAGAGD